MLRALGGEPAGAAGEPPAQRTPSRWELLGMVLMGALLLVFVITNPRLALVLLYTMASGGRGGGFSGGRGGGGFSGGGGRSGGGGASGSW